MTTFATHLSDVYRYVYQFGQKGHQIGRKIGDAVEIITLGMVARTPGLPERMKMERGLEGATSAEHKVEFGFYHLNGSGQLVDDSIENLFGLIECKKVGVEVTVKQSFKAWKRRTGGTLDSEGYSFSVNPRWTERKRKVQLFGEEGKLIIRIAQSDSADEVHEIEPKQGYRLAFALDLEDEFHYVTPSGGLHDLPRAIASCTIVTVSRIADSGLPVIVVEDCLRGPQTPEKAKQASFVALDVRKRITGHFDKGDDPRRPFTAILVIGEPSHWEEKSRSMVRLCNDFNLTVPDTVVIDFFEACRARYGEAFQDEIRKSKFESDQGMRDCVEAVLVSHESRVLQDLDTGDFVELLLDTSGDRCVLDVRPMSD